MPKLASPARPVPPPPIEETRSYYSLGFRIDPLTIARLNKVAQALGVPVSNVIKQCIWAHLPTLEKLELSHTQLQ